MAYDRTALFDFTRLRFHGSLPVAVEEIDLDGLVRDIVSELSAGLRGAARAKISTAPMSIVPYTGNCAPD
jgi:hypothetical protein